MKNTVLLCVGIAVILAISPAVPLGALGGGETLSSHPDALPTTVALFQDHDPWGYTAIKDILNMHGISYDVYTSAEMDKVNIWQYDKVITASVQGNEFWNALEANRWRFENYTAGGGVLEMHLCAMPGSVSPGKVYPGGFVFHYTTINLISIVDPDHPVLHNPNTVTDDDLDNWSASAHGWFVETAPEAHDVLVSTDYSKPVWAEVALGSGLIFATTQTVEWRAGGGYPEFLENMILYMPTPSFQYHFRLNPYIDIFHMNTNPGGWVNGIVETPSYSVPLLGKYEGGKAYIAWDLPAGGIEMGFIVINIPTRDGEMMRITDTLEVIGPEYVWLTPAAGALAEGPTLDRDVGSKVTPAAWYDFVTNPYADVVHLNTDLAPWLWGWADYAPPCYPAPVLGYYMGGKFHFAMDYIDGCGGYELSFWAGTAATRDGRFIRTYDGISYVGPEYFWLTPP